MVVIDQLLKSNPPSRLQNKDLTIILVIVINLFLILQLYLHGNNTRNIGKNTRFNQLNK